MGLTKQYLRYVHQETFGIIGSRQSNINFVNFRKTTGRYAAVGACEDVIIWDLRSRAKALVLKGGKSPVTVIKTSPCQNHLAVGYVDGGISVFDLDNGQVVFQFNGHKSPVTVLNYNKDGFVLVSGGKDTNVILWDVLQGAGMYRLKGHKGPITQAVFATEHNVLITSSKDTFVKFWDLDTQHCFHTIVAHRSEVSDIVLTPNQELLTGCGDSELRVWALKSNTNVDENKAKKLRLDMSQSAPDEDDPEEEEKDALCPIESLKIGSVMRQSKERLLSMKIDSTGRNLVCLNNDSSIEVYSLSTNEELEKKLMKRQKKMRRKHDQTEDDAKLNLTDAFKKFGDLKVAKKGHSFDCVVEKNILKVVCLSSNNTLSWYCINMSIPWQDKIERELLHTFGHRTDIRTICFSSDNTAILTASADSVKIWNRTYVQCISTFECDYALCSLFLPGDRLCIIGTKSGKLQLFEIATANLLETFDAHDGPIWGIHMSPDKNGICSGSGDKCLKFWSFEWLTTENETITSKRLTLQHQRTLQMDEGILALSYSPNNLLIAVALMDNTVKLFYTDTLKFFVSLYGHSMPVLCLDISSDSEYIITGSADRDVKLWGLDFGDCHKSFFAHDGSVTCVKFIPNTHMFFSCGKDKKIRQWDGDNFLPIMTLQGHQDEIRCLAVSSSSNFIATASHDKTIRLWEKSEEIVIPEEEKEKEREEELDKEHEETELQIPGEDSKEVGHASRMTLDTVKSIDKLMEVLALHKEQSEKPAKEQAEDAASNPLMRAYNVDSSEKLVREIFTRIRMSEMEGTLFGLPYDQAIILLKLLQTFIESKWNTVRVVDAIIFLLRIHHNQIANDKKILPLMIQLNKSVQSTVTQLVDTSGYNLHGLKMFQRLQDEVVDELGL